MADDENKTQEAEEEEIQQETAASEVQSEASQQSQTASQTLSEDQIASLKDTITKDVSGQVSQEVSKSVIQKIGEAFGLTKKQEKSLPTDAEELQKIVETKLDEKMSRMQEDFEKQEKETKAEKDKRVNGIVQGWFFQYSQLSRMGKVPQIKEAKEGDLGFDARKKIILTIGKMIEKNEAQGIKYTPSVADVLVAYPDILKSPPGADLPISGNTQVAETGESFKYSDIRNKSFEEIAQGI